MDFVDRESHSGIKYNEIPEMGDILNAFRGNMARGAAFLGELLTDEVREVDLDNYESVARTPVVLDLPYITYDDLTRNKPSYGLRAEQEFHNPITRYYLATTVPSNTYFEALLEKGYSRGETLFLLGLHIADRSLYTYLELQEHVTSGLLQIGNARYVNTLLVKEQLGKLTATHFDRFRKTLQAAAVDGADISNITNLPYFRELEIRLSEDQFIKKLN